MAAKNKKPKKLVLLDAHSIIHRAYHALPDFKSIKGEPTGALYGLVAMLIKIIKDLNPDYIVAAYDLPDETFRHRVYEGYKATRAKTEEDLVHQLQRSRDIFEALAIPIYDKSGFEADDVIGTVVEKLKDEKDIDIIIASGDLDTLQLVDEKRVRVYTLRRGLSDTIIYDEEAVKDRFGFSPELLVDYKGLRGDPSDNIPGIRGIGEKTATNLIQKFGTIEEMYIVLKKDPEEFKNAGFTPRIIKLLEEGEEEALFSKTLGLIRRDTPIDFVLPDEWRDVVDSAKVRNLFKELNFKTLLDRFHTLVTPGVTNAGKGKEIKLEKEEIEEKIDTEEVEKIAIGVWLLNSDITNPTLEDILSFTETTSFKEAKKKVLKDIKDKDLEYIYNEIELPIISSVKKMEEHGVLLDVKYLRKLSKDYRKELQKLEKKIYKHAGIEFNINSPRQMAEILFDKMKLHDMPRQMRLLKTPTGQRSTKISELEKLQGIHPIIDDIISYREYQKLLSTYIEPLADMADKSDRLHAKFSQTGTTTGRFSSSNPNLQNIPIRTELGYAIRNAFIAPKNFKLVAFDYSQVDLRSLALLSGDEYLIKTFKEGKDIHGSVASRVFDVAEEKVTRDMRRQAKVINFGIIYGMGIMSLRKSLDSTMAEAKKFHEDYFKKFPTIKRYLEDTKAFAHKHGYTETLFGRKRYYPDIASKLPYVRSAAERMAINFPIQGTSADIIKLAMRYTESALDQAGLLGDVHLNLQVHDELVYEIKENKVDEAAKVIRRAMEEIIPQKFFKGKEKIPLEVSVSVGKDWGSMV